MFCGTKDCKNISTVTSRKDFYNAELLCEEVYAIFKASLN
jgi:hypothetical protein